MLNSSIFPTLTVALRRILVWGVPSLAILGLVGLARLRWLRISEARNRPVSPPPTPAGTTGACSSPMSGTTEQHSMSDDSGLVDDVRSSNDKQELPIKQPTSDTNSPSSIIPTCVQSCIPCVHTMRTSSNVRLPSCGKEHSDDPLDIKEPLKSVFSAKCSLQQPTLCCGEINFEVSAGETDTSGELSSKTHDSSGGDSLSASNPVPGEVISANSVQLKPCNDPDCSSLNSHTMCCQHNSELSTAVTSRNTVINRKDRVRIQLQLPRDIIGRFIGKQGRNIKALMVDSDGAHVYINQKNVPKDTPFVPCTVQGTAKQVDEAIAIIESKYPEVIIPGTLVNGSPMEQFQQTTSIPTPLFGTSSKYECLESWDFQLSMASIPPNPFSACVTYLESLRYIWVVACERSMELEDQHQSMSFAYCYSGVINHNLHLVDKGNPELLGKFCAVRVSEIHWLRGRISKFGDDQSSYEVQLVDYGSDVVVPQSAIKPLRKEHCKLPAQAFKTQLAHLKPNKEDMGEGLIAMQLMLDSVVLEVHVTDKIPLLSGAEKKNDDISTLFPSLPSASLTAEPKVNGDRPEVSAPPGKSSKGRISSVTPGQSGGIKMAYAGTYDKGKKAMSSSDESGEVQIASNVETSDEAKKELSSPGEDVEKQKVSSSPGEGSKEKELLSCPSGNIDETKGVLSEQPGENVKMKSIPRDLGVVKEASEHGQPFLPEEELTMDLPPLAPYVPVVELYTQLGAQTPIFVNRELVELGYAIWIEEKSIL